MKEQKWRTDWGKGGPVTSPNWYPAEGDIPKPDTITDVMVFLHTEASMAALWEAQQAIERVRCSYSELKDRSWGPYGWIRERLEEAEEEGKHIGPHRKTSSLKQTGPPKISHKNKAQIRQYTLTYMSLPTHIQQRTAWSGLSEDDVSKPRDTWVPMEWGRLGCCNIFMVIWKEEWGEELLEGRLRRG